MFKAPGLPVFVPSPPPLLSINYQNEEYEIKIINSFIFQGWSASGVPLADGRLPVSYQQRDAASGPTGALMHLNCWLRGNSSSGVQLTPTSSASVRRTPHEPPPESELSVVSHLIGVRDESIIVDLGHNSFANLISMQLWDREPRYIINSSTINLFFLA